MKLAKPFIGDIAIISSGDNMEVDFYSKFKDAVKNKKAQKSIKWKKSADAPAVTAQ